MRHLKIIFILLTSNFMVNGQVYNRNLNENAEQFIKRIKPDSLEIAHTVIQTDTWTKDQKAIIAFLGYDMPDANKGFNFVIGYLLYPTDDNKYRLMLLDPIEEDGGLPEVISVFFANADNDKEKELGVICKFWQHSHEHSGDLYKGFIYDNPTRDKKALAFDSKLLNKFWGCDCDYRESKSEKAKYKTAKDIKDELKRLGF